MKDGVGEIVTIPAKAVHGMLQLNLPGNRENASKDVCFIKALLVSLCTLKKIQSMDESEKLENGIVNFMKGEYFCSNSFKIISLNNYH